MLNPKPFKDSPETPLIIEWPELGDTVTETYDASSASIITAQIAGDFTSAEVTIMGSCDGVDYFPLTDLNTGLDLVISHPGIFTVAEKVLFVAPVVADQGSDEEVKVTFIVWRAK